MAKARTQFSCCWCLFFYLSDPPSNITAYNKSSTSIAVTWNPIRPNDLKRKNISGHRVSVEETSNRTWRGNHLFVCRVAQAILLKNLQVYTNYCIIMASFTSKIIGNSSQCVFATTGEEGNMYVKQSRVVQCRNLKRCLTFSAKKWLLLLLLFFFIYLFSFFALCGCLHVFF